ncbi:MAG: hydantoinase/oxoprolinase family protein [Pusillimonas sp.]
MYKVGIDIGGTFTDVVITAETGRRYTAKVPSNREDPSQAIQEVIDSLLPEWKIPPDQITQFRHGTTVATNAVLERRGSVIGLITTEGFEDVLEVGRQNRTQIYDLILKPETPVFLAPGQFRQGVQERTSPQGLVEVPVDLNMLDTVVDRLIASGAEAIALVFLFSYANPENEKLAAEHIRKRFPQLSISLSSAIDPMFREYERTVVTAFDAYVKRVIGNYLVNMEKRLKAAHIPAVLQVMQSRGGMANADIAAMRPVRLFLSGPAAGVIGARNVAEQNRIDDAITLDIGGTSSDIAIISGGAAQIKQEARIDGYNVRVPMVDVNSIGSGGGSVAWIDTSGGLRVGPRSAGSQPGPACYGRGGEDPTVTDASIVLGLLDPAYFAGGTLPLYPELARKAIQAKIAGPLNISVEEAAAGIHRVVTSQMAEGIRLVSIGRGIDPRSYTLIPFGGGGGIHAIPVCDELSINHILVPLSPGVLCADGLLNAPTEHEYSFSYVTAFDAASPGDILATCQSLRDQCAALMVIEGVADSSVQTTYFADVCYSGQSHYIEVPLDISVPERLVQTAYEHFVAAHERLYGHSTRNNATFVNLRAVQRTCASATHIGFVEAIDAHPSTTMRDVRFVNAERKSPTPIYKRSTLKSGARIDGPAIVEQADTTLPIEPGWTAVVAPTGAIILERNA